MPSKQEVRDTEPKSNTLTDVNEWPLHHRIAAEALLFLMGPLHATGELVGPGGGTSAKQWFHLIGGTIFWVILVGLAIRMGSTPNGQIPFVVMPA